MARSRSLAHRAGRLFGLGLGEAPERIDFGAFRLTVSPSDSGGRLYRDAGYWADVHSPLEREIVDVLRPAVFLDIGANYGFTSLVHHAVNPSALIIAIEPSPSLVSALSRNLHDNGCTNARVVNAVCGDRVGMEQFAVNPDTSQDNRVIGEPAWPTVSVPSVTLDSLLLPAHQADAVYIKVDTQGYEERVFRGGASFFAASSRWLVRAEFAPKWLRAQGTDPGRFLHSLVERFAVVELPKRIRYRGDELGSLARQRLRGEDASRFADYIERLGGGDGWCDILVSPSTLDLSTTRGSA